jgi:ABC-type Fe3+ transport system substrate-binding protein
MEAAEPTFGRPNGIGVAKNAPHPHAALLFVDFMLSREGQEIIKARNRVPSSSAVDSNLNKFDYQMIDPVIVLDEAGKWGKAVVRLVSERRGDSARGREIMFSPRARASEME